jgi:hypothetical protein
MVMFEIKACCCIYVSVKETTLTYLEAGHGMPI